MREENGLSQVNEYAGIYHIITVYTYLIYNEEYNISMFFKINVL